MNVGIINFHFSINFGAVLQCLALTEYIKKLGHSPLVIDYEPEYIRQQQSPFPSPFYYGKWAFIEYKDAKTWTKIKHIVIRFIHAIVDYRYFYIKIKRRRIWRSYIKQNLPLTKRYNNYLELLENPPIFDAYITGSDQVWNPKVTHANLDPAYFLDFTKGSVVKLAYAVSPCQIDIHKYREEVTNYLRTFNGVSLREGQFSVFFQECYHNKVEICIDPTLLLKKDDYLKYEEKEDTLPSHYILIYGFIDRSNPTLICNIAEDISKYTGYQIIDISLEKIITPKNTKWEKSISVGKFLYYLHNADYIVTNSFHGTAFSLIYQKNFWSIEKALTASRVHELMLKLNLSERLVSKYDVNLVNDTIEKIIDYDHVDELLGEFRKKSENFILNSLSTV